MRIVLSTSLFLVLGSQAVAQDWGRTHLSQDLLRFAQQSFPNRTRIDQRKIYRAAKAKGWLRSAPATRLLKRQLRTLSAGRFVTLQPKVQAPPAPRTSLLAEVEYNESEGYATDLGSLVSTLTGNGAFATSADTDVFRFTLPLDGVVTINTTTSGTIPDMCLANAAGEESWGYFFFDPTAVTIPLPAGTYCMKMAGAVGDTYSFTLNVSLNNLPVLAGGTTTNLSVGNDPGAARLVLTQDSRVKLDITNNVSADTRLVLMSSTWGYVFDVDDASTSPTFDAGLDAQLPAGTYYVYLFADTAATAAVATTVTASPVPTLSGSASGSVVTQEGFELFRLTTTATEKLNLSIAGSGALPMTDTLMFLLDNSMGHILEADDRQADFLSQMEPSVPAGTYYVASTGFWDEGDFTVSVSNAASAIVNVTARTNTLTLPADGTGSYRFSLATPSRIEIDIDGFGIDGQIGVMNAVTGQAYSWEDDDAIGNDDVIVGMELPAGDYLIQVRDYQGDAGTFDLQVRPPLHVDPSGNANLIGRGGSPLFLLVSAAAAAPSNPLPGIISGNLLVDLNAGVILNSSLPSSGLRNFNAALPAGVFLQVVEVDPATALGVFSNLLQ